MHIRSYIAVIISLGSLWLYSTTLLAKTTYTSLKEDKEHIRRWNNFVDELYQLHLQQTRDLQINTREQDGGYGGKTGSQDFYREIEYYDTDKQRLLSRIQWEKQQPDRIHSIEVFIYGDNNKVSHDFYARYLPEFRNAPIQTLINIHHYNDKLHSFRQFDASGDLIYETCRGEYFNEAIQLHLEEDEIPEARNSRDEEQAELYRACFTGVSQEAGELLQPAKFFNRPAVSNKPLDSESSALEQALHNTNLAIRQQPQQAELYLKRGNIYFNLHQFDQAVADFSQALSLDDQLDQAYYGRGMALARDGKIQAGIADLTVYIQRHPQDSNARTKRGVRYIWAKQLAEAKRDLTAAIQLNPQNAEAHDDLGVVLAQEKNYQAALHHFSQAIQHDPSYQKAYHNLSMVYLILNQPDKALRQIDRALSLSPESRNSLLLKSEILSALGRNQEAQQLANQAEFLPEGNWSEYFAIQK